ncbi:hypothetical protein TCAL_02695 [Tigriopus californicus]|uniref:Uncharacterized protein n=1 Tax=Tigriopus californicus TaxID=6832 RepID=A0A553PH57_TIGCA|nr:uncharacterized protein LOC131880344 [Tigriopus californicus]TRY77005.1 hypothetical protein TCAL_02695 [Tigriopus californicus]|eukprot:TCALIF_02695-PA protein Name:"Protein of unknown function" AED:0.00 eAED:0.00 QI:189/1/1/1/0.75/0.6/5/155/250
MPLPNYGYNNQEDKRSQELVFEMAPEWVDAEDQYDGNRNDYRSSLSNGGSRKNSTSKRAQVTTGKLGIDLERKMVIHSDKDKEIWRKPSIDPQDLADARKFSSPNRRELRSDLKSNLDSLISSDKLKDIRAGKRPTLEDSPSDISIPSLYGNPVPKATSYGYNKPRSSYEIQERRGSSSSANRFSSSPSPRTSLTERTRYGQDLGDGATTSSFSTYGGNGNESSYKIREVSSHQVISRSVGGSKMPRSIY